MVKNLPANAGDLRDMGSIPGWGRSPEGGHDNPLQYSCLENPVDRGASWAIVHGVMKIQTRLSEQTATTTKMGMEKEMATHSSILAWGIPMDRGVWWATVHRVAKSWTQLSNFTFSRTVCCIL